MDCEEPRHKLGMGFQIGPNSVQNVFSGSRLFDMSQLLSCCIRLKLRKFFYLPILRK
jgi:hypothetical protein